MKQSNTSRYAYLAGIIDGEGCIRVNRHDDGERNYPSYSLRIQVAQKNGTLIDWLYGNFGGTVTHANKNSRFLRASGEIVDVSHHDYRWSINTVEKLLPILKRILPFSIEKKKQIEVAINVCHFLTKYRRSMIVHGNRRLHRSSDSAAHYTNTCENYMKTLQELKRITIPCAAVETKLIETSKEVKL